MHHGNDYSGIHCKGCLVREVAHLQMYCIGVIITEKKTIIWDHKTCPLSD